MAEMARGLTAEVVTDLWLCRSAWIEFDQEWHQPVVHAAPEPRPAHPLVESYARRRGTRRYVVAVRTHPRAKRPPG